MTIQAGSTGTSLVASGGTFTISYIVNTPTVSSGSRIYVFRSNDGSNWIPNTPDSTCILDATLTCIFRTDHLSYFGFVSSLSTSLIDTTAPIVTLSGASNITIAQNSIYTDSGASWVDDFDGSGSILTGSLGQTGSFTQTIKDASGTTL